VRQRALTVDDVGAPSAVSTVWSQGVVMAARLPRAHLTGRWPLCAQGDALPELIIATTDACPGLGREHQESPMRQRSGTRWRHDSPIIFRMILRAGHSGGSPMSRISVAVIL
jgi:hypothetical protein